MEHPKNVFGGHYYGQIILYGHFSRRQRRRRHRNLMEEVSYLSINKLMVLSIGTFGGLSNPECDD